MDICISEDSPGVENPVPKASALPRDKDQRWRVRLGYTFEVDSIQGYANRVADDFSWLLRTFGDMDKWGQREKEFKNRHC